MKSSFKKICVSVLFIGTLAFAEELNSAEAGTEVSSEAAPSVSEPEPEPIVYTPPPPPPPPPPPKEVEMPKVSAPKSDFIKVGARVSAGISNFRSHLPITIDNRDMNLKPNLQLGIGVVTELNLIDAFLLVPGLQYSYATQSAKRIELDWRFKNVREAEVSLHSIDIPVLLRFGLPLDLFLEVGPQVGFALSSTTTLLNENDGNANRDESFDTKKLNTVSYGITAGLGYSLGDVLVGVRGHFGLREYAELTNGYPWHVQLGLTYNFFTN
ncbi:MAG: PorT family protein [Fibromonadales bacterium]|nr:PorT family protein [Fibromonadales bacterium]